MTDEPGPPPFTPTHYQLLPSDQKATQALYDQRPQSVEELLARYRAGERRFSFASLANAQLDGVDLREALFDSANLIGAMLRGADLRGCSFQSASLQRARLDGALLAGASFMMADARRAVLTGTDLSGVGFLLADLSEAQLSPKLSRANLKGAKLRSVDLRWAYLTNADLEGADLTDSNLRNARLTGAKLTEANLRGADLRNLEGARFDATYIGEAILSPRSKDSWARLRRRYTGPMFAVHMLFLVVFAIPFVMRTAFWIGVNRAQESVMQVNLQLRKFADDLQTRDHERARILGEELGRTELTPCLHPRCRKWIVAEVLLELDRPWIYWSTAIALLLYNVLRGIMTTRVSLLRDMEERSRRTPAWKDYRWLAVLHPVATALFVVAVVTLAVHLFDWLRTPIWLPES